jgi:2Fe-2S ferredoxin
MPLINVTTRSGESRVIEAPSKGTLKDALITGGIDEINAITNCGGCCSCGTCHVYIDPADMPKLRSMEPQEDDLLSIHDDRRPNSRLSCQVNLSPDLDGLGVTVAPEW